MSLVSSLSIESTVCQEKIRAVPLSVCLSGFGRHFRTANGGAYSAGDDNFKLSRTTERIDDFLSHDWQTCRFDKTLCLMLAFNFQAAAIVATIVSLLCGVARIYGLLTNHWSTIFLGYASFALTLCIWQRIRVLFGKSRLVFLDCLCIPQHDEQLKREGILNLLGLLAASEQLTILWSRNWISRLWCVFELAAFLRAENGRNRKPIQLLPVKMGSVVMLQSVSWTLLTVSYTLVKEVTEADIEDGVESDENANSILLQLALLVVVFGAIVLFLLPSFLYIGLGITQELSKLNAQLLEFRVQDVECFCCSHGHRHPVTGEALACDRELVHGMLRKWFSSSAQSYLDTFNALVQAELSSRVNHLAISKILPTSYVLYAANACNMPWLIDFIPWWASSELTGTAWSLWFLRGFLLWSLNTVVMIAMMRIAVILSKCFVAYESRRARILSTLMQVPIMFGVFLLLWLPFRVTYVMTDDLSLLPGIPYAAVLGFTVYLFNRKSLVEEKAKAKEFRFQLDHVQSDDEAALGPIAERELSISSRASRASVEQLEDTASAASGALGARSSDATITAVF